ncbi:hypothetical protein JSE7799_03725 [Jannaschia seosinensis]|uniref:Uncharacterized protein n=1 Tax=Jannaschia seosinensis TaxID=313367 RepID=A0A0M7BGK4_9RHOB|nr:hypothetical protein JSE7799_03725 [Jannaschia seosinensis]
MVALQDLFDPAVEALDHSVGLRRLRRGQAVVDVEGGAKRVEGVLSRGSPLAQAENAGGELLAIVGENGADADRAGALQIAQEAPCVGRGLCREDTDEDPSGRPVDGHEEVTAAGLIGHLRQVFHVDVEVARLVGLEGAVLRLGRLGLQVAQVSHAMPAQAAIQPRARGVRVQELPHNRQQIIQRHQQRLSQGHRDGLLRWCQRRLEPVRRVAAIRDAVALAPLVNGLLRYAEALGQHRSRLRARLDRRPHLRRGRGLLVKMYQHGRAPSRRSLRTDLAMKSADRRGER